MIRNLIIATLLVVLSACSISANKINGRNAPLVTRTLADIPAFTAIDASAGFDITYTQGSSTSVVITFSDVVADLVRAEVVNGTLVLGLKSHGESISNVTLKAVVTGPNLSAISISSGAELDVKNAMTGSNLAISASSAGEVELHGATYDNIAIEASSGGDVEIEALRGKNVAASASSGGDIELSGTATTVALSASSGGSVTAKGLAADNGTASASSGGSVSSNIKDPVISKSSGGSVSNR